jgi:hypothetical protein
MSVNIGIAIALAIVGVLCVAYGLHYALSETKVRFHYVWFALAAVLVAPAILMAVGVWDDIPLALHWVVVGALLLLEDRSHSTAQNLYFAAELIDPLHDSVGIITTDYHMARSLALARKAGIAHVSGITVKSFELFPLSSIVRESIAWAKDILLGNA